MWTGKSANYGVTPAMYDCKIRFFGTFEIEIFRKKVSLDHWKSRKARTLLKMLVANRGERVSRDVLIDQLWPHMPPRKALACLHTTVYFVRQALKPYMPLDPYRDARAASRGFIHYSGGAYSFNVQGKAWFDVEEVEAFFARGVEMHDVNRREALAYYERVVELYKGDFLSEATYEEWTQLPRQRYRDIYINSLENAALIECAEGRLSHALQFYRQILRDDPYREDIHEAYVRCLISAGWIGEATKHITQYSQMMRDELGVEPSPDIVDLIHTERRIAT